MKKNKVQKRERRKVRIRSRINGTAGRPRLVVFRSLKKNYAQLVDDVSGKTLMGESDAAFAKKGTKLERAKQVGVAIAKKAATKGITACVFDRNGYKYHGRVKALADGAREGGLKF